MHVVFFAKVPDEEVLYRSEFYGADIRALQELGHDVTVSIDPWHIPAGDLYFVWWWTWAAFPLVHGICRRKPVIIAGTFDHVLPDGTLQFYPRRSRLHRALIRWALRQSSANVVPSRDQFEYLRQHFQPAGLTLAPHGVDTALYSPAPSIARERFFLTICSLDPGSAWRRCTPELLIAFATARQQLRGYRLVIAGRRGASYPELSRLAAELRIADVVDFIGTVSRDEKIALLRRCTAFLQPTRAEGFGVAILEAMSCGALVVTSPVGAVPEVAGDTVVYVDGSDPRAISAAILKVVKSPAEFAGLAERARSRAIAKFGSQRRADGIRAVLDWVCASPSSTRAAVSWHHPAPQ